MSQELVVYVVLCAVSFIIVLCVFNYSTPASSCSLVISGESVRVSGCELNSILLEGIANLKPYKH